MIYTKWSDDDSTLRDILRWNKDNLTFALDDGGQKWSAEGLWDFLSSSDDGEQELSKRAWMMGGYIYIQGKKYMQIIDGEWKGKEFIETEF